MIRIFGKNYTPRIIKTTEEKPVEKLIHNPKTGQFKEVVNALIKINHLAKEFESQSPDMADFTDYNGWEDRDAFFEALDDFKQEQHERFYALKNKVIDLALKAGHLRYLGKHEHIGGFSDSVGSRFAKKTENGRVIGEFHTNYQNPVSNNNLGFLQNDSSKPKYYSSNLTEEEARGILQNYISSQKNKSGKKFLKNKALLKKKI